MALVRCSIHGKPVGRTREYSLAVKPLGFPQTSAICGSANCREPGLVWLEAAENAAYVRGERIFRVPTFAVKIRVE